MNKNVEYISKLRTRLLEMVGTEIKELYKDTFQDDWLLINQSVDKTFLEHIELIDTDLSELDFIGYDYYGYLEYLQGKCDILSWFFNYDENVALYLKAKHSFKDFINSIGHIRSASMGFSRYTNLF